MNQEPLVTIVTPSFNQGQFVEETILSVLNQTYSNIEYIFVDGGSTDGTMDIVEKYRDRIDVIIHEKDKGQADAINKGFKIAKGELVGWLNSDDLFYPDCVEKIVELYLSNKNGAIYYHSFNNMIDSDGGLLKTYQRIIPDRSYLLKTNYNVIQMGSFYQRNLVEKVDYLDISNHYCMDLDLWLNLLTWGPILYTSDSPHTAFRIYTGTKTDTGKEKFLVNIHKVLKKHGARFYDRTVFLMIYIYWIKIKVKKILVK